MTDIKSIVWGLVFRGDGQSPTSAAGWWVDTSTMIDMTRWKQLRRGPRPYGIISVKGETVTEPQLDAIEQRINRKLGDEQYDERALALGADVDMSQDTSPVDMDYVQAFDQVGQAILAIHGIGKAFVGLSENQTYGGNAAAQQKALTVVQSDLDLLAGEWSQLAQDEGEGVTVVYKVQPLDDPELVTEQMKLDFDAGMLLGKEWRARRGLPPFGDWRDEARVTPNGLVDDRVKPEEKAAAPEQTGLSVPFSKSYQHLTSMAKAMSVQRLERRPIVAIDMDNTLAEYDGQFDPRYIGAAIPEQVAMVRELREAGCQIVIFTCRDDDDLTARWLQDNDVPYDSINCNPDGSEGSGKVFADVYYDDKAVNAKEGISAIANLLPSGRCKDRLSREPVSEKLGIVMLEARPQVAELVKQYQLERINPVTLLDDGFEQWPHVTVLYGIVGTPIADVVAMVRKMPQIDAVFGPLSTFDNPEYSVLKVEVESPLLHKWNQRLQDALPVQETFPDYRPHMTVAYMDQEAADGHRGACELTGMATRFTHAVVSMHGQKVRVPLVATIASMYEKNQLLLDEHGVTEK